MKTINILLFIFIMSLFASGCSTTNSTHPQKVKNTSAISLKAPNELAKYGAEADLQQAINKLNQGQTNQSIAELENILKRYKSHNNELEIRIYTLLAIEALKVGDDIGFNFYRSQLKYYAKNTIRLPVQSQVILAMKGNTENFSVQQRILNWFQQIQ